MADVQQRIAASERRLHLVAAVPAPAAKGPYSLLELWHLLSLDAPCVAALWVVFIAWCDGLRVSPLDPVAMFVAVWMLYAADRLLDAQPLALGVDVPELEARHRFHHRHRARFVPVLTVAAAALAFLIHRTAPSVLHLYAVLAALLGGWLLLVHAQPRLRAQARRLPKELAVGVFFPAAVFIPTVARLPGTRSALLPGALLLAAACTLNCLFLYAWEHPQARGHAHRSTQFALGFLQPLAVVGTLLGVAAAATIQPGNPLQHPAALPLAATLSIGLLLLLHSVRHRRPPLLQRALTDLTLLTPVLPLGLCLLLKAR